MNKSQIALTFVAMAITSLASAQSEDQTLGARPLHEVAVDAMNRGIKKVYLYPDSSHPDFSVAPIAKLSKMLSRDIVLVNVIGSLPSITKTDSDIVTWARLMVEDDLLGRPPAKFTPYFDVPDEIFPAAGEVLLIGHGGTLTVDGVALITRREDKLDFILRNPRCIILGDVYGGITFPGREDQAVFAVDAGGHLTPQDPNSAIAKDVADSASNTLEGLRSYIAGHRNEISVRRIRELTK